MCEHEIDTKIVNGIIITYCKKCGAILAQKPVEYSINCQENPAYPDNGGQILYG